MSLLDPSMDDLPVEVTVDILSRLPVKTIIHCKCVCTKWRNIVLGAYFADVQLLRSPKGFMIYHLKSKKLEYHKYEEDELDHHHLHHLDPVMTIDLNLVPNYHGYAAFHVGSVNGLVCMWHPGLRNDNILICNPITREYMILPMQQFEGLLFCFGFGFLMHDYKVIMISEGRTPQQPNHIIRKAEVYTLGTGEWRSLGHFPYSLHAYYCGVFLNGHAHWTIIDGKDSPESIYAFDFDKETFELFPSPTSEAIDQMRVFKCLQVLNGCLCQCECYDNKFTVWVMKEYGIKSSWHKELVIEKGISPNLKFPLYVIDGFNDGTILMASCGKVLFVYCPRRKIIVDMHIFNGNFTGYAYRPSFHRLQNFENERVYVF